MKLMEVLRPLFEDKKQWIKDQLGMAIIGCYITDGSVDDPIKGQIADYHHDIHFAEYDHDQSAIEEANREISEELDTILEHMTKIDPTPNNKYLPWIARRYADGDFLLYEDHEKIHDLLKLFHTHKRHIAKRDINQYTSTQELVQAVRPFMESGGDDAKEQKLLANDEAEIIYDDGENQIIVPHTYEASKYYAKEKFQTNWCTGYPDMYEHYSSHGPLYIIHNKQTNDVWQVHFESDVDGEIHGTDNRPWQIKDIDDDEVADRNHFYTTNSAFSWLVAQRFDDGAEAGNEVYYLFEVYYAVQDDMIVNHTLLEAIEMLSHEAITLIEHLLEEQKELPTTEGRLAEILPLEDTHPRITKDITGDSLYKLVLDDYSDLDTMIDTIEAYEVSDLLDGSFIANFDIRDMEGQDPLYSLDYHSNNDRYEQLLLGAIISEVKSGIIHDESLLERFENELESIDSVEDLYQLISNTPYWLETDIQNVVVALNDAYNYAIIEATQKSVKDEVIEELSYVYGIEFNHPDENGHIPISSETVFKIIFKDLYPGKHMRQWLDEHSEHSEPLHDFEYTWNLEHPSVEELYRHFKKLGY